SHSSHILKRIAHIALVVRDYDEAIRFYVDKLGFTLLEDTPLSPEKRWVLVSPSDGSGCCLLLARAVGEMQESRIGNQTGGRVFLFLYTDNFQRDYHNMLANGVRFVREPKEEPYGTVAVFEDLYGNLWDLLESK
ncbi:MAG TPA: VOC family protein, partial [Saprospiraceae bacterium]|nr:VOC family protein [Saprospiraceae bacterium]HPI09171.1 VOC family protein [Saprospiraceae bacterium]